MSSFFFHEICQVPRASASAVAFAMGLFGGQGNLGLGKQRAFAVSTESRASDILLRFYDTCQSYKVGAYCLRALFVDIFMSNSHFLDLLATLQLC